MAQAIITSMTKRLQLVQAQQAAGLDGPACQREQCNSVLAEIAGLRGRLNTDEAIMVSTALADLSWNSDEKVKIASAINEVANSTAGKGTAQTQYCPCLENYLTEACTAFLKDPEKSIQAKLYCMAHHMSTWSLYLGEEKLYTTPRPWRLYLL